MAKKKLFTLNILSFGHNILFSIVNITVINLAIYFPILRVPDQYLQPYKVLSAFCKMPHLFSRYSFSKEDWFSSLDQLLFIHICLICGCYWSFWKVQTKTELLWQQKRTWAQTFIHSRRNWVSVYRYTNESSQLQTLKASLQCVWCCSAISHQGIIQYL